MTDAVVASVSVEPTPVLTRAEIIQARIAELHAAVPVNVAQVAVATQHLSLLQEIKNAIAKIEAEIAHLLHLSSTITPTPVVAVSASVAPVVSVSVTASV